MRTLAFWRSLQMQMMGALVVLMILISSALPLQYQHGDRGKCSHQLMPMQRAHGVIGSPDAVCSLLTRGRRSSCRPPRP